MALQRENKEYIKIDNYDLNNNWVGIRIFKDKEHRATGDIDPFCKSYLESINIVDLRGVINTTTIKEFNEETTVNNVIKTICYLQLKTLEEFSLCSDC
jgi:hypothetical protein